MIILVCKTSTFSLRRGQRYNEMLNNKINQKFLIPLFNVELGEPIKLSIDEDEFVEKLTAFIFPEPI